MAFYFINEIPIQPLLKPKNKQDRRIHNTQNSQERTKKGRFAASGGSGCQPSKENSIPP